MGKVCFVSRMVLGLIYTVFGGMGLGIALGVMKMPQPQMPEAATAFMAGIMGSGYFFPVLKITETVGGLMLLSGFGAAAALVILAPVTLHIVLFHMVLTPGIENQGLSLLMAATHVLAMIGYAGVYRPLFGVTRCCQGTK